MPSAPEIGDTGCHVRHVEVGRQAESQQIPTPESDIGIPAKDLGHYINDMIIKAVAGATQEDSPEFLKIQFNGAAAMQEDPDGSPPPTP